MPRDGSGVYSLPTGTKVTANTTIESAPYNAFLEDVVSDLNDERPITAGGTGGATASEARENLGVDAAAGFAIKGANYTALASDKNKHFRFTGAFTFSLAAVATLGAGWRCIAQADGGELTIDPDGSETINGAATLAVPDGGFVILQCDGAAIYATTDPITPAKTTANIEAALNGGRLGTITKLITDWDDATETGFYYGNSATNSPTDAYYMGLVTVHNGDWITQEVTLFTATNEANTECFRRERRGTWSSWYRVYKSATEIQELDYTDPFVVFDGTTGTILESNKVSSLSRTGTGQYTVTFEAGAFANANYMGAGSAVKPDSANDGNIRVQVGGNTTNVQSSTVTYIKTTQNISTAAYESAKIGVIFFGGQ